MKKYLIYTFLFLLILTFGFISSCQKDEAASGTDAELFAMAKSTSGFVFYKNSNSLLPKSSGTGHSESFLKTRYNAIAAAALATGANLKDGTSFPEGAVIVKELYKTEAAISRYAVLYKKTGHADADTKGWVWGYINANGTVAATASDKGSGCQSCHSQSGNIDYMLMKKFFP